MSVPASPGSAVGAAKWAAVMLLSAAAGGGLVYSVMSRAPATARADAASTTPPNVPSMLNPPVVVQVMPAIAPAGIAPLPASNATAPVQTAVLPEPAHPRSSPRPTEASPTIEAPPTRPREVAPRIEPTPGTLSPRESKPTAPSPARRININTAARAELELLPGVGPVLAKSIIDHREKHGPYRTPQDLDAVKGIGEKTLAKLLPLITVDPEPRPR